MYCIYTFSNIYGRKSIRRFHAYAVILQYREGHEVVPLSGTTRPRICIQKYAVYWLGPGRYKTRAGKRANK
jgi:hypothetical protein